MYRISTVYCLTEQVFQVLTQKGSITIWDELAELYSLKEGCWAGFPLPVSRFIRELQLWRSCYGCNLGIAISKSLQLHKHPKPHRNRFEWTLCCFFQWCYKNYNVIFVFQQVHPLFNSQLNQCLLLWNITVRPLQITDHTEVNLLILQSYRLPQERKSDDWS